jgi:preprotein translocase subunit SecY
MTIVLLAVYRLGSHIPTPGVNAQVLTDIFDRAQGTVLGMVDMFTGGALKQLTVFALGIMPYITASIILQLLTVVIPALERLAKEGEQGRKKITEYTRYGTIILSAVQSFGISIGLENMEGVVQTPGWSFRLITMITLTAGTSFIMWLGEQITERGIGNGISLIIFAGIVARLPVALARTVDVLRNGEMQIFALIGLLVIMALVVAGVILMQQATRKIPVQYPQRHVGRRVYGGQSTHIPLKLNTAGVIPVIFASSIIAFPVTIARFTNHQGLKDFVDMNFSQGDMLYNVLYALLIIFFSYFYTSIVFNPTELAENMKKYGGYVPGVRAGKKTASFIDAILTRITLAGAIFLAVIAILPQILMGSMKVPFYFGGTGLLIVVGVALDTMQQIESHLLTRHYEGFMKKGKLRGRR